MVVATHSHIPQVGERYRVIYDPEDPLHAESPDVLRARSLYGYGDVLTVALCVVALLMFAGCGALADRAPRAPSVPSTPT